VRSKSRIWKAFPLSIPFERSFRFDFIADRALKINRNNANGSTCAFLQITAILTARSYLSYILETMLYTSTNQLVGGSPLLSRAFEWIRSTAELRFACRAQKSRIARTVEPRPLTLIEQWAYLSDTIKGALSRTEEATRCHKSAALQLDLAQYALASLVDELAAVMDVGGRRQPATIHVFDAQPPPLSPRPLDEAIAA
jgi:hypothetical protein